MKTIEVSDELYDKLMELSYELNNQDNRSTSQPYFFQIETKEKVPAADGCGSPAYVMDGTMIETNEEINEAVSEWFGNIKSLSSSETDSVDEILEKIGYRKVWYEISKTYHNAFLTEKACKTHIALNKHHYNEPADYLTHAFRNPELETVITFLSGLYLIKNEKEKKDE
jgi:hypothetical protein